MRHWRYGRDEMKGQTVKVGNVVRVIRRAVTKRAAIDGLVGEVTDTRGDEVFVRCEKRAFWIETKLVKLCK